MSMLGKILAVFNVLAAFLFIYILASDYSKQQSFAYADFRTELILTGLPVDREEKDVDGVPLVNRISDFTAQQIFQGGQPVKTLIEEVDRVQKKVLSEIDQEANKPAKLAAILGPMARTGPERDALLEKIKNPETGMSILDRLFQAAKEEHQRQMKKEERQPENFDPFQWALENKIPLEDLPIAKDEKGNDQKRDPGEMRETIAHLLFNCASDDQERQRVAIVVGIKAYANEVNREADALSAMVHRIRLEMQRDLSGFEAVQPQLVKAIEEYAEKILDAQKQLENQEALYKSHNSLAMQRETDRKELWTKLANARNATAKARQLLAKEQKFYFDAEAEVGARDKANKKLEKEIRTKEKVGTER